MANRYPLILNSSAGQLQELPIGDSLDLGGEGIVGVKVGSAGAPSITFTGNTNTGIYSPGANQVALSTNGTGRLFVDASGRISNASSPTNLAGLSIESSENSCLAIEAGASTPNVGIYISKKQGSGDLGNWDAININGNDNVSYESRIAWQFDSITEGPIIAGKRTSSSGTDLSFYTTTSEVATEKLRITSAGLVGIGTSVPTSKLYVSGPISAPSLTFNTDELLTLRGGTVSGSFGVDNSSPFGFYIQAKINTPDSRPLLLNPAGGNVGIGTTNPGAKLEVNGGEIHSVNGPITQYLSSGGGAAVIGTLSNSDWSVRTNNVERCRVDTSGRLLVGTSTKLGSTEKKLEVANGTLGNSNFANNAFASAVLFEKGRGTTVGTIVQNNDELGSLIFRGDDGVDSFTTAAQIVAHVDGTPGTNDMPGRLVFSTTADGASSPTERMRIAATGRIDTFSSHPNYGINALSSAAAGTSISTFAGVHSATGYGSGTISFRVWTNGNVVNTNNSYGSISDVKLKENIVDANSQWDDLKALRPVNYNFKEGQTHTQLGLIAQEVELVSPGLVSESPDLDKEGNNLGTTTKSVNYSVLYMKAVKALQEAMERIETLEAKVAALEAS